MRPRLLFGAFVTTAVLVAGASIATTAVSSPAAADARVLPGSLPSWTAEPGTERLAAAPDTELSLSVLVDPAQIADAPDVRAWLIDGGLDVGALRESVSALPVTGTASEVGAVFGTTFSQYRVGELEAVAPDAALTVPAELAAVIDVSGTVNADVFRPASARAAHVTNEPQPEESDRTVPVLADDGDCAAHWGEELTDEWPESVDVEHRSNALCGYLPAQLRQIHDVPAEYTGESTTIAIVGAYDDPSTEANTNTYFTEAGAQPFARDQYRHHAPANPDNDRCGGPQSWTEEQHLDVQAAHAMAPDADIVYWGAAECTTTSMFTRILDAVEGDQTPDVISLSFGAVEDLDTAADRELLNRVLVEAASQGVSVFSSSGNDGDYSMVGDHPHISVTSPASSPYITAVGGTSTGLGADGEIVVEAGWEIQTRFARNGGVIPPGFAFGAGGGESSVFDRPTWQRDVLDEPGTRRLVPDVASIGDPNTGFVVYGPHDGQTEYATHGGTSLATPMVASMVALAKAATGVEVGLAAPSLYALMGTDAIRDVTPASAGTWAAQGPDAGAIYPETIFTWDTKPQTLQSGPGWDDVTGLGVPTGRAFIENFGKELDR